MATLDDVRRLAESLPEVTSKLSWGHEMWRVRDKSFVWERPLRKTDLAALGDAAPEGEILGVRVADEGEKQALIASEPDIYFTIPHFDGYAAVLVRLAAVEEDELEEIVTEAWLLRAPKRLAQQFLAERELGQA